ncbi:MAG: FAD-dependent oxidoreductase [Ruminococcaceae bacterium]|nr:FAD-dependent oxidoreductase [Oscillospiraceae bacterium]
MFYDIIVVGAGPAGLTAALYALRADKKVLVIEKSTPGGQITYSPKVENYPGFMEMSGNEFADLLLDQIMAQGADFELGKVIEIKNGDVKTVVTEDGEFTAKAVIIATGVKHRMLGLEGENELVGRGISFCAVCDGAFYKDKTVAVIGGGNSALQEAILLSDTAKKVYVVQNLEKLTGEAKLQSIIEKKENIEVILGTVVNSLETENGELVAIELLGGGKRSRLETDGMFIAIGLIPENKPFESLAKLNDYGYFDSDESCTTATEGIFVAGDCRSKRIRQITTATADGAVAALAACEWLD